MPFVWLFGGVAALIGGGFFLKEVDESSNNLIALGLLALAVILLIKEK